MQIKSFDRQNLKVVRKAMDEAFAKIRTDLGVDLRVGNIRFNENTFSTRIQASTLSSVQSGVQTIGIKKAYDSLTMLSNIRGYDEKVLSDADVNKEFKHGYGRSAKTYIILGAAIRSTKFPVIAKEKRSGKEFKFPYSDTARALGRKFELSAIDEQIEREREYRAEGRAEAMGS